MAFDRIVVHPKIMGGAPCIAGTRIPVDAIERFIAKGQTPEQIIADYPQLTSNDISQALDYAKANPTQPYRLTHGTIPNATCPFCGSTKIERREPEIDCGAMWLNSALFYALADRHRTLRCRRCEMDFEPPKAAAP